MKKDSVGPRRRERSTSLDDMRRDLRERFRRLRIPRLPSFEELKRRRFFWIPYEDIDPGIRDFCRKINRLSYAVTVGSCEGHSKEELLRRGYPLATIERDFPQGYSPAYVSVYVTSARRREFFEWLKTVIDFDEVTIHMEPVKESRFERWEPTMDVAYTSDKVFKVFINSKGVHMPLRSLAWTQR